MKVRRLGLTGGGRDGGERVLIESERETEIRMWRYAYERVSVEVTGCVGRCAWLFFGERRERIICIDIGIDIIETCITCNIYIL